MMRKPKTTFADLPHPPLVLASILAADFTRLGDEVEDVLRAGVHGVHVDVMDGHFVPNLTMGPDVVRSLRRRFPDLFLDVHLMVQRPERFIAPFAEAGADHLTFHIEATLGRKDLHEGEMIRRVREAGCGVGVAINPSTPVAGVYHVLDQLDLVLVMTVHPGFAGQSLRTDVLEKVRDLRQRISAQRAEGWVVIDGGVNPRTVEPVLEAGAQVIVAASALFGAEDRSALVRTLRGERR